MGGGQEHEVDRKSSYPEVDGHLLLAWPYPKPTDTISRLQDRYPNLQITFLNTRSEQITPETWATVTVLSTFSTLPPDASYIPKMQFIHLLSAGSNHLTKHPVYTSSEITLTTSSGIHGPSISEWITLTLLSYAHKFPMLLSWQSTRRWVPGSEAGKALTGVRDYAGQTLAVLGYGSIGRQTARVGAALGMRVIAYTASPRDTAEKRRDEGFIVPGTGDADGSIPSAWFSGTSKESLHEFLSQDIDVLVISVPLTAATKHLLDTPEFSILGRSSGRKPFIVNIARGQILVQPALISALKEFETSEGKSGVRGASVDVADPEPLPEDDPLWTAPNVFVSPHISGYVDVYAERAAMVLEGNLEKFRRGEELWNVVDRKRGY